VAERLESKSPEGRAVHIDVKRVDAGFEGEVVLGEGATRVRRAVETRTCEAVIEALALIVALDHEPEAEEPSPLPMCPCRCAAGHSARGFSTFPSRDAVAKTTSPSADRARAILAFGATVSGTSFTEGAVFPGGAFFVDVASTIGLGEVRWLLPSARLAIGRTLPTVAGGDALQPEFTLTALTIDACPIGLALIPQVDVRACGRVEIGTVRAGARGDESSLTSRLWQGGGALARARWVLVTTGALRPMVELSSGVLAPLQRDRFHFGALASSPTLSAPSYEGMVAISVGVVLP
jgi:hypothetical protein